MLVVAVMAQTKSTQMVYLEHSETLSFDEARLPDAQILKGNVCFRHDSALMYCDSAYFYDKKNSLHAFGHVHLIQGDSIEGFGDKLHYDGNTKIAKFRKHVKLIHNGRTTLRTDYMDYDRAKDVAYYFSGGTIEDTVNILKSIRGTYTPSNNQAIFSGEVELVNPKYVLTTDTLWYNTETYQADLMSPTKIVYEYETTILSSKGWYNTKTELSMLLDRSQIIHTDGMTLTGDTIYYDKALGYGKVLGNMQSIDSTNHLTLYGNKGEVWDSDNHGYVTDSALLIEWSDSTMYTYMHADSLFTDQIPYQIYRLVEKDSVMVDSVWQHPAPDTLWIDTTYLQVQAFCNVRIYREDVQSVCDSMHYNGKDSIATLSGDPVSWNENNQVSADTVIIYTKDGSVDYIHGIGNAIAIKQDTEQEYNQLAGKEMFAYVKDGDLYKVDVQGNAETVFYPREEDGTFMGVNKTQSSFVTLYLENRQIHHIRFTSSTAGVMIPMDQATREEKYLVTFFWADHERPRKPGDVFLHPMRTPRPDAAAISASAEDIEEDEE